MSDERPPPLPHPQLVYAPPAPPPNRIGWADLYILAGSVALVSGLIIPTLFVAGIDRLTPVNSQMVSWIPIPALTFGGLFGGIRLVAWAERRRRQRPGVIAPARR